MCISHFQRVLVVAIEPIVKRGPTGITLSNLFEGWPKESLAQLYIQDDEPDFGICSQSFWLDARFAPCDFYVRRLLAKNTLRFAPATPGLTAMARGAPIRVKAGIHMIARGINDASPLVLPGSLMDWVREFSPDVIYSPLGSIRVMKLLLAVAGVSERPIVPHFMDDWPETMYSGSILLGYPRRILCQSLENILHRSPFGLCIGEAMAEEYEQRYGMPFKYALHCVEEHCFTEPTLSNSDRPIITYIGGLHLDRWQPLLTISRAAVKLGCEMRIFAPPDDLKTFAGQFRDIGAIKFGSLPPEKVVNELQHADVVAHVESFDSAIIAYTRLSVSTKLSQYMAAGKPILACGPEQLASMKVIQSAKAGVVVGCNELQTVQAALTKLLEDQDYRLMLAQNAHTYARKCYTKEIARERFRRLITEAAIA
jgi:hypothetical protein